jgi:hypothetical protein
MTTLREYGQHTWHYSFNNEAKTEVTFKNHCVFCDEVVEELALYLMATGFFQSNIIEAFEKYVDEHKPAFINSAKRLDGEEVDKYDIFSSMVGEGE